MKKMKNVSGVKVVVQVRRSPKEQICLQMLVARNNIGDVIIIR
jgi:hypothetical protein